MEASRQPRPEPVFDIREEIRSEIKKGATDPYKIAKKLMRSIGKDRIAELAELYVVTICRGIMSDNRRSSFVVDVEEPTAPGPALNADKWSNGVVHVPGNGYVRYADLTAADCDAIADEREKVAEGYKDEARRFRALAKAIVKAGVKTAGALKESVRAEILK